MTAPPRSRVLSSLDDAARWAEHASRSLHPLLAVGAFSAALLWEAVTSLAPATPGLPDWIWRLGVTIGLCIGLSVPFLLWAYLTAAVFLILSLLGRDVDLPATGSAIGLTFAFAAVGKAAEVVIKLLGAAAVAPWAYVGSGLGGLGAALLVLARSEKVAPEEAVLAVATSTAGLELAYYLLTH
jgi:hypothetical protein